jgi:hypothetical protein
VAVAQADRARVDDPPPIGQPVEWHVRVPDHHRRLGQPGERRLVVRDRAVHQDELVVVPGRAVAERHRPQTVDVQRDGQRQIGQQIAVRPADPGRAPRVVLGGRVRGQAAGLERAVERRGQVPVAVAPHPDHPVAQFGQPVQGRRGHRAVGDVAVQHHRVHPGRIDVAEHRVQRGQVAVDVS